MGRHNQRRIPFFLPSKTLMASLPDHDDGHFENVLVRNPRRR